MKKASLLLYTIFLLCLSSNLAVGQTFNHNRYGSLADYLNSIFGLDPNVGLTAFPILNIPMGGRSEGMAGAFAAVADDISFLQYNPAGSSMLANTELALFHNNWIADTNIGALAWASRRNELGFAAGIVWLYLPFTEYNMYGQRVAAGYYSEGVGTLNISHNFFRSYSFGGISLGANLKTAFRIVPDFTDADDQGNNQGQLIAGSGRSQSTAMAMFDVGMLTRFNFLKTYYSRDFNTSLALVFRNLGPPAMGEPLPSALVAALGYRPIRPLLFSFDFTMPMNFMNFSLSERPFWALGFAADVTSFLSVRTGFMAKTGNARITVGSAVHLRNMSIDMNYTLDLLTQLQPLNRVSVGVRLNLGDQGRQVRRDKVDELYLLGIDAYSVMDFESARSFWEEALSMDPRFTPARDGLNLIQRTLDTEERIREMQRLFD